VPKTSVDHLRESPLSQTDEDGRQIGNLILRALSRKECAEIFHSLDFVHLEPYQVLQDTGGAIPSVYFLNEGMGSVGD
jgi:hypothetical protein